MAIATYSRLYRAFNNAGIAPWQVDAGGMKTRHGSEASFDRMIAVNLKSVCSHLYRAPEIRCSTNHSVAALDAASNPAT